MELHLRKTRDTCSRCKYCPHMEITIKNKKKVVERSVIRKRFVENIRQLIVYLKPDTLYITGSAMVSGCYHPDTGDDFIVHYGMMKIKELNLINPENFKWSCELDIYRLPKTTILYEVLRGIYIIDPNDKISLYTEQCPYWEAIPKDISYHDAIQNMTGTTT